MSSLSIRPLDFPGCYQILPKLVRDARGEFIKPFVKAEFERLHLCTDFAEEYYTRSHKDVIRGMHFQLPPFEHVKLVSLLHGRILDVIVDLRVGSPTFTKRQSMALDASESTVLYLAPGIAHGFLALSEMALVSYQVSSIYSEKHDAGIRWDSLGVDWGISDPITSARDSAFPKLAEFESPFVYHPEKAAP
jgi:dTDP-4-dehydrorhamnose 3,5-epimerase